MGGPESVVRTDDTRSPHLTTAMSSVSSALNRNFQTALSLATMDKIPSVSQTSQTTCFTPATTSSSATATSAGSSWFSFSSSSSTSTSTTGGLLTSFTSSNTSGGSMRDYNVWMPQSM